jgi:hypothetical protein
MSILQQWSILTKVKFVSGKKLQMLPTVGAYLDFPRFFRPQSFDGSDIMVFEHPDFFMDFVGIVEDMLVISGMSMKAVMIWLGQ